MKIANLQQQLESARHQTEVVRTNVELESVSSSPQTLECVVVSPKKLLVFNPNCNDATPKFGSTSVPPPFPQIRGEDASAGVLTGAAAENQGFFGRRMSSSSQTPGRVVFCPIFHTDSSERSRS